MWIDPTSYDATLVANALYGLRNIRERDTDKVLDPTIDAQITKGIQRLDELQARLSRQCN